MYEWEEGNGRDQLGQIKHLSCVRGEQSVTINAHMRVPSTLNSCVARMNHLR